MKSRDFCRKAQRRRLDELEGPSVWLLNFRANWRSAPPVLGRFLCALGQLAVQNYILQIDRVSHHPVNFLIGKHRLDAFFLQFLGRAVFSQDLHAQLAMLDIDFGMERPELERPLGYPGIVLANGLEIARDAFGRVAGLRHGNAVQPRFGGAVSPVIHGKFDAWQRLSIDDVLPRQADTFAELEPVFRMGHMFAADDVFSLLFDRFGQPFAADLNVRATNQHAVILDRYLELPIIHIFGPALQLWFGAPSRPKMLIPGKRMLSHVTALFAQKRFAIVIRAQKPIQSVHRFDFLSSATWT